MKTSTAADVRHVPEMQRKDCAQSCVQAIQHAATAAEKSFPLLRSANVAYKDMYMGMNLHPTAGCFQSERERWGGRGGGGAACPPPRVFLLFNSLPRPTRLPHLRQPPPPGLSAPVSAPTLPPAGESVAAAPPLHPPCWRTSPPQPPSWVISQRTA
jgi:hypothetical protein